MRLAGWMEDERPGARRRVFDGQVAFASATVQGSLSIGRSAVVHCIIVCMYM